uniref:Uncharacterized protein n=1 Tax=Panagrolaimus sp. PS1159 TaxID=55785 RepID=A0AC35FQX0_9BILA
MSLLQPSVIETTDKDDPLGKLVEFSNRFGTTQTATVTHNHSNITNGSPTSDPATRMSALFDVAANHFIPYHQGYGAYSTPWNTVGNGHNGNGNNNNNNVVVGNDNTSPNWLTAALTGSAYDPSAAAAAAASSWFTSYHQHPSTTLPSTTSTTQNRMSSSDAVTAAAAVAAYGSTYLNSLPTAGLLPTIPSSLTPSLNVSSPNFNNNTLTNSRARGNNPNKQTTNKYSAKTACQCPTCVKTATEAQSPKLALKIA